MKPKTIKPKAKRISALFLALFTVLMLFPADIAFAEIDTSIFDGGSGTADDPWQIRTLEQLENFRDSTNGTVDRITAERTGNESYEGKSIKLTADIDLSGITYWTPICRWSDFKGVFDGNGHEIKNLSISGYSDAYPSLFARVHGKITNLKVSGSIDWGYSYSGGIAAYLLGGTIENCYSNVIVGAVSDNSGGIVGYAISGAVVRNCHSSASIIGSGSTGGIVGYLDNSLVENCYSEASTSGSVSIGGIVGECNGGTVKNCYNKGTVSASSNQIGGVVGSLKTGRVTGCYNTGSVTGGSLSCQVGGIVGLSSQNYGSKTSCTIENCYNTGAVSTSYNAGNTIGGVVGSLYTGTLKNSYNTGTVSEPSNHGRGGVCGNDDWSTATEIKNCYYLEGVATHGKHEKDDAVGSTECKTEAEFRSGEVAWLMQHGQGSQVWGQTLAEDENGDAYPLLTDTPSKEVYKVAFMRKSTANSDTYTEQKSYYVNSGAIVQAPQLTNSGYAEVYWAPKDNRETPFDENTPIESDMTLYAIGREIIQATSASDTLRLTSGQEITVDLNNYVENKSGNSKDFSFEFVDGFLPDGLEFSGNTLSGTPTNPGSYFAFFKVTNNNGLALMSLNEENDYLCLDFIVSAPQTLISNYEELKAFRDSVNENGKTYEGEVVMLTADIDMYAPIGLTGNLYLWSPIGRSSRPFMGTFDGNGHKLTNLYFEGESEYRGLFGYVGESAVIKNLSVSGSVSTSSYVGGIVAYNNGTIENCCSDVTVTATGEYAGGIAGYNVGTITDCCNKNTVSGSVSSYVGGITGYSIGNISKCYNTGDVSGLSNVGGIAGENFSNISDCYNIGTVSGLSSTGGIAGKNFSKVNYCYNTGTINGSYGSFIGGIIGENNNIDSVKYCYYLEGSCNGENNGGQSISSEELRNQDMFLMNGWNFDTVWYMGDERPLLIEPDFTPNNNPGSGSDQNPNPDPNPGQDDEVFRIMGPILEYDTLNANIEFGRTGTYTVIFVHFAGNKLDNAAYTEFTVTEPQQAYIEIQNPEFLLANGDKIMLVSDLATMKPLCSAYTVYTEQ